MIIKWAVIGSLLGFFVFHPLIHLISVFHASNGQKIEIDFVSEILTAFSVSMLPWSLTFVVFSALIGIFYRKNKDANEKKSKLIIQLQESLAEIKILSGLLPICASCKNIRDDKGYWNQIEVYISGHSEAEFSHSICPECAKKLYPDIYADK
jgi:hypothetical protein